MGFINVLDHVKHCYTNYDGDVIFKLIKKELDNNNIATVSFSGVKSIPSSFVNAAFITLLDYYDFSFIRSRIRIVNSTKQINDMIKHRFDFEVEVKKSEKILISV